MSLFSNWKYRIKSEPRGYVSIKGDYYFYVHKNVGWIFERWDYINSHDSFEKAEKYVNDMIEPYTERYYP